MKKLGIYIHIPFCKRRCLYCGFFSQVPPEMATKKLLDGYVQNLIGQIMAKGDRYRKEYVVDSIFLGGGTPSMLSAEAVEALLGAVRESFVVTSDAEITMEANPDTLDRKKLKRCRAAGVNRLSMGVQSLDDNILCKLGRIHTAAEAVEKYHLAREAGFANINLDLMFAIPGQSMKQWMDTLVETVNLAPEHISFYNLQIEEDTPFYEAYLDGKLEPMDEKLDRAMYHDAIRFLKEHGYDHYEISNVAKPGKACRHNLKYWSFQDYLGLGDSASSFVDGIRWTEKPREEYHENDFEDNTGEYVFTGLRKTEGIRKSEFAQRFGKDFWEVYGDRMKYLQEYFDRGLLLEEGDFLRLSEEGIDISNSIMAVFV